MRNTLQEVKLKEKFEGDDKDKIEKAVQETLDWLAGVVNPITMIHCRASRSECHPPFFLPRATARLVGQRPVHELLHPSSLQIQSALLRKKIARPVPLFIYLFTHPYCNPE